MINPTFSKLASAYQLHFYLCFKSHSLRPVFAGDGISELLNEVSRSVCDRENYHLLESQVSPDHLRFLVSLKPEHTVSNAVNLMKGNMSRQLGLTLGGKQPWFATGYFARSSGKVGVETVRGYVASQVAHHGYRGKWTEALEYRNSRFRSPAFQPAHCVTILTYHLVVATVGRASVFDEAIAPKLFDYLNAVGDRHSFVIDRVSLMPDHIHLVLEASPTKSIQSIVLALMNNTAHWMGQHYWGVLKETDAWGVWQPSFYAGTTGEYTTAQVKRFLGSN
jgi:putative transposase